MTISNRKERVGYEYQSYDACITTITVKYKRTILGSEHIVEQRIDEDLIKEIVVTSLNQDNLELVEFKLDNGINNGWEGYGMAERQVSKPYFKGIEISYKETKVVKKNLV